MIDLTAGVAQVPSMLRGTLDWIWRRRQAVENTNAHASVDRGAWPAALTELCPAKCGSAP